MTIAEQNYLSSIFSLDPFLLRSKSLQVIVIVVSVFTNLLQEEHCFKYFVSSLPPAPKTPTPRASRTCLGLMTSSGSFKLCLCCVLMMIVLAGTSLLLSRAPSRSCNFEMSCHHHWPSYRLQNNVTYTITSRMGSYEVYEYQDQQSHAHIWVIGDTFWIQGNLYLI